MKKQRYAEPEQDYKKEKKQHNTLMNSLKKHFKGDENEMQEEEKEDIQERSPKHKNMNKDDRKRMTIMIMKKKMKG